MKRTIVPGNSLRYFWTIASTKSLKKSISTLFLKWQDCKNYYQTCIVWKTYNDTPESHIHLFKIVPVSSVERLPLRSSVDEVERGPLPGGKHEVAFGCEMTTGQELVGGDVAVSQLLANDPSDRLLLMHLSVQGVDAVAGEKWASCNRYFISLYTSFWQSNLGLDRNMSW